MSNRGCDTELWRYGLKRGRHHAVRGRKSGKTDNRKWSVLEVESKAEALAKIEEQNAQIIMGGNETVDGVLAFYRDHKRNDWDKNYQRSEDRILTHFSGMSVLDINRSICRAYIRSREDDGMSANTIRIEMSHLRAALKLASGEGHIEKFDTDKLIVPTSNASRKRWLTQEEYQALHASAIEPHVRLFMLLALATAGRPSHIYDLTWAQVNLDQGHIKFLKDDQAQTKKRRPTVPIQGSLIEELRLARSVAESDYVIEYRGDGIADIKTGLAAAVKRSGINPVGVSSYVFRHTAGTWMAMAGVPLLQIAEFMGHDSIDTTRKHYLHFMPDHLKDASNALTIPSPSVSNVIAEGGQIETMLISEGDKCSPSS